MRVMINIRIIIKKMNNINQFIGAICGIKKYSVIILIWQINVIYLTNFFH